MISSDTDLYNVSLPDILTLCNAVHKFLIMYNIHGATEKFYDS